MHRSIGIRINIRIRIPPKIRIPMSKRDPRKDEQRPGTASTPGSKSSTTYTRFHHCISVMRCHCAILLSPGSTSTGPPLGLPEMKTAQTTRMNSSNLQPYAISIPAARCKAAPPTHNHPEHAISYDLPIRTPQDLPSGRLFRKTSHSTCSTNTRPNTPKNPK